MIKIVIDANILVSAIFGGIPLKAVIKAFQNNIYYSREIKMELTKLPEKLSNKLLIPYRIEFRKLINKLLLNSSEIKTSKKITICRDFKDNCYLYTALSAKAEFLITGDKDLLEIPRSDLNNVGLKKLKIISPAEFINYKS